MSGLLVVSAAHLPVPQRNHSAAISEFRRGPPALERLMGSGKLLGGFLCSSVPLWLQNNPIGF